MTITSRVQQELFATTTIPPEFDPDQQQPPDVPRKRLIRLGLTAVPPKGPTRRLGRPWTHDEHERFLAAIERHPHGPWKLIAACVGTRNTRQTMTHAQKYRQKIARWRRGTTEPAWLVPTTTETDGHAAGVDKVTIEDRHIPPPLGPKGHPHLVPSTSQDLDELLLDELCWNLEDRAMPQTASTGEDQLLATLGTFLPPTHLSRTDSQLDAAINELLGAVDIDSPLTVDLHELLL